MTESGLKKDNVTDRVRAKLLRGNYKDYAQIAREEGTTASFVAKQAYLLKKEGKIDGDRRSTNGKEEQGSTGTVLAIPVDREKIDANRIKAYRLMGIPEADLAIMEAAHTDLAGLKKMREEARALRHDKLAEQIAKEFKTTPELNNFIAFYRAVLKTGVSQEQYEHVMTNVSESFTLEQQIHEQTNQVTDLDDKSSGVNLKLQNANIELGKKTKKNEELSSTNKRLEDRNNELRLYFRNIGEGKEGFEEVNQLVRQAFDRLFGNDPRWKLVIKAVAIAAARYPDEFKEWAIHTVAGDDEYIMENAERLVAPLVEAQMVLRKELEIEATEAQRRKILESAISDQQ